MQNKFKILNGNELLIEGGLEAGINLFTGYPGSPLADFFNILYERKSELSKEGIKVVIANSEAHAGAMASGAKMAHQNVLVGMKSMGLHVASDALSVGNFANPGKGGVVIAVGDDPWSISTSTPADSRYLFKHLHIPFLEPATPQELKDWIKKALFLSQNSSVYTGLILTTHLAEGGGRVELCERPKISSEPLELNPSEFNLSENVMVPPNSLLADKAMIEKRFPKVIENLEKLNLDQIFGDESSKIGLISSGAIFETLKQVLEEQKKLDHLSLYKLGSSYPLIENKLLPFLKTKEIVIVIEEKRGFLETELKELSQKHNLNLKIFGKKFGEENLFPSFGGLNYEIISEKLNWLNEKLSFQFSNCLLYSQNHISLDFSLPKRLPTFCPGCPHRETLSLLKDLRIKLQKKNINLISHGDVGCYSLSFLEPFKEMHDLSAMGQGGALGAGTDIFVKNPSVVLMGDSTFFHSGMTAISNSVQLGHNITYILLDNDNTAMTGHQVTPRTGIAVDGENRPRQNMLQIVKAMKVNQALEINPSDRYFYQNILSEVIQSPGTKVIISTKECALTFGARQKKIERDFFKNGDTQKTKVFYQINTFACEDCRECVEMTGCPGLSQTFDAYGTKVMIDHQICVNDSYCTKIKACPSFEMVEVQNYHPTKYLSKNTHEQNVIPLPQQKISLDDIANGKDFRLVVIGVGGSGVTTISRVLAEAALHMAGRTDIDFKFVDQKGLAQRNGSVSSFLSLFAKGKSHGPITPLNSADLVLSPDLLEGARALNYLAQDGLALIDNDYQIPLSMLLDRGIEHDPIDEDQIRNNLKNRYHDLVQLRDFKKLSFQKFSKAVYASSMILGAAFQAGLLPFAHEDLISAIERSVPKSEISNNLEAFELGRDIYLNKTILETSESIDVKLFEESMLESINFWQNKNRFRILFRNELKRWRELLPSIPEIHLANYLHDLFVYDLGATLHQVYSDLVRVSQLYQKDELKLAVRLLIKTYWIKDEVFVSHQLSSSLKKSIDEKKYSQLGSGFKITHINRPHFEIWGKSIEFDFYPKDWLLKIMSHLRMLRLLMPSWHKKEKEIAKAIRTKVLNGLKYVELKKLDNVKGYREVRYKYYDQLVEKL
jgi:indolepyruvate ferredoxin oxidoreductase